MTSCVRQKQGFIEGHVFTATGVDEPFVAIPGLRRAFLFGREANNFFIITLIRDQSGP